MTSLEDMLFNLDDSESVRETFSRAPFGYPGSKFKSLAKILPELPYYKVFVEVFGGAGNVILNRKRSVLDVFNDRYGGVVAFYRVLRDPVLLKRLMDRLSLTIHAREEFIFCKETWDKIDDDVERAARWYYMIQCSFISKGSYFARATNSPAPFNIHNLLPLFPGIHDRFKTIQVENLDWEQCLKDFDSPDTVFYLDPPYYGLDPGLYGHKFGKNEHTRMLEMIQGLSGFVALSGYTNELYDSYKWTEKREWDVTVTAKALASTITNFQEASSTTVRQQATEVLWIKS